VNERQDPAAARIGESAKCFLHELYLSRS
jgi:hypothetical protein